MGVTIKCKKTGREMDVGYFGFFKLRTKVAELVGSEVGEHYKKLDDILDIPSPEKEHALESYNDETERLVESKELPIKIADFLYQSDCDGKIRYGACKHKLIVKFFIALVLIQQFENLVNGIKVVHELLLSLVI